MGEAEETRRTIMILLSSFAGIAVLLAMMGLYGTLAYSVVQRTRELGIRWSLGAKRSNILFFVLREGITLTAIGLVIGTFGALALTKLLASLLFQISPTDIGAFAFANVLLLAVAAFAALIPAWRATRIGPLQALRAV